MILSLRTAWRIGRMKIDGTRRALPEATVKRNGTANGRAGRIQRLKTRILRNMITIPKIKTIGIVRLCKRNPDELNVPRERRHFPELWLLRARFGSERHTRGVANEFAVRFPLIN